MYKDVKKKLLSVVLCVCMVIGAVQIVPRAKAAATGSNGSYQVTIGTIGTAQTQVVNVKLASASTEYSYTNQEKKPAIADVQTASGASIKAEFNSELVIIGDNVNAGTFHGVLSPKSGGKYFADESEASQIPFTIKQATPQKIIPDKGSVLNPVLKYAAGGQSPDLASVTVVLTNGNQITYTGKDAISKHFSLSKISAVGRDQECTITLTDNVNFDSSVTEKVLCDVAYDLADSTFAAL